MLEPADNNNTFYSTAIMSASPSVRTSRLSKIGHFGTRYTYNTRTSDRYYNSLIKDRSLRYKIHIQH